MTIIDIAAFRAREAQGMITCSPHPTEDLLIWNYTKKCQFAWAWDEITLQARGLITRSDGTIFALGFPKFFNLFESPETNLLNLPDLPCEITAKLDGSLGILYWTADGPAIATRGSFSSAQARWATRFLQKKQRSFPPHDLTLLFEIIYPQNRIVLNYNKEENLYLIGARDVQSGYDYPYKDLLAFGQQYDFPVVPCMEHTSIHNLLPLMQTMKGVEGWVARFPDGLRIKIKTEDYLHLHRLIAQITPNHVREMLLADNNGWNEFLEQLPDEFQQEAQTLAKEMLAQVDEQEQQILAIYESIKHLAQPSRKMYAIQVMSEYKSISAYLFALLDNKDIRPLLLQHLALTNDEIEVE